MRILTNHEKQKGGLRIPEETHDLPRRLKVLVQSKLLKYTCRKPRTYVNIVSATQKTKPRLIACQENTERYHTYNEYYMYI